MALKAKVTAEEFSGLDENLKVFYRQVGDVYTLDAEGVEDVTGLKKVLEEVKADRAKLRSEMQQIRQQYGDVDPEAARQAIAEMQKMHDKKLLDEGKVEELIVQRTERMKLEHENQLKARDRKLQEIENNNKALSSKLSEVLIDTSLTSAATKAGVRPTAIPDVINRGRAVWRLDGDRPMPLQPDGTVIIGKDGKTPLTVDEWMGSLQQQAPHLFEASTGSGSDPGKSGVFRSVGRQIVLTREQARDVATFRQAQAEAAKSGIEVVVQG